MEVIRSCKAVVAHILGRVDVTDSKLRDKLEEAKTLYIAFDLMDLDGNGELTLEEMLQAMTCSGDEPLAEDEVKQFEEFFKNADIDGSGTLTVHEYILAHVNHDQKTESVDHRMVDRAVEAVHAAL